MADRRRLPPGETGGPAEEGLLPPCCHHERGHLPPLFDGGAGVGYIRYVLLDRHRLPPGERGLVGREEVTFDEFDIGRHDIPIPDPDDIAGNEVPCGDRLPPAVAEHPCLEREPLFQHGDGVSGLALLPETDDRVHEEEEEDDREVLPAPYDGGDDERRLDHPRYGPPRSSAGTF